MQQVTLQPGDYLTTVGMTEDDYHAVARAFMTAGASKGEYPDNFYFEGFECIGWCVINDAVWHQRTRYFEVVKSSRQLTIDQVLNATNAGGKGDDMHITDKLCKARRERDESQARYEQALAEHREAYPWLLIEERKQPTEDMTDPANWRTGDWLECVCTTPDLTRGLTYQVKSVTTNHEPVIQDDDGAYVTRSAKCFRFYHRPIASAYNGMPAN